MTDNNQTEDKTPAGSGEAQQDVAQASDTKAEAASTAKASDELTEDDLDRVAGGVTATVEQAFLVALGRPGLSPSGGHFPARQGSQPQVAIQTSVYNALVSEGLFPTGR